jgi:gliding motility-associated-like protein
MIGNANAIPFITTWKTDNLSSSSSNDNQITIPINGSGYNYDIYWEEVGNPTNNGTEPSGQTGSYTITFPSVGIYRVEISGQFPRIYFNSGSYLSVKDSEKILTVEQWGDIAWTSMNRAFAGCTNLRINAVDAPDLSGVTDMTRMFYHAEVFNDNINHWDVSNVTNMFGLFSFTDTFNQPLNSWDISNVTNMSEMFYFARDFNQDLQFVVGGANTGGDAWNTTNVTTMQSMFGGAASFNGNVSDWYVDNVTNMQSMFGSAEAFNQDIGGWQITSVTNLSGMFNGALTFDQDISFKVGGGNNGGNAWDTNGVLNMAATFKDAVAFSQSITNWDVSTVTNMREMFSGHPTFNQDITGWIVNNVDDMEDMFSDATFFNQNISTWIVTNVNDMSGMFDNATAFNQDISGWDVSGVSDMRLMFQDASSFNQNLATWDVSNLSLAVNMFRNSGLSVANYDNLLIGWSAKTLKSNVSFGAQGIFYCAGESARADIITNFNWFITDGGLNCISVFDGISTTTPQIANAQVTPIDFGSIDVLPSTKIRNFTIENKQAIPINNVLVAISGTVFSTSSTPVIIGPEGTLTITVVLSGSTQGGFTETLSITSDDFAGSFQFSLTGEITGTPEPEIAIFEGIDILGNPILDGLSSYDIGTADRGMDVTNQFTITNRGSAALTISGMLITGSAFSLGTSAPFSIPVDNSVTIDVTLSGAVAGGFFEILTITSDDTDEGTFDFEVSGQINGPNILVVDGLDIFSDPEILNGQVTPIDFGSATEGSNIVRQLIITNSAQVDLSISDISISGSAFTFSSPTLPFGVAREIDGIYDEVLFEITLSGATGATFNETVTILNDDDADPIFEFSLTGQITAPEIEVYEGATTSGAVIVDGQVTPVDFGTDFQGNNITQQFTIENSGSEILNISSVVISGSAFILGATAPTSIAIGATETFDVILSGTSLGIFTETITITNNDSDETVFDFPITGEIIAIPEPEIAVFEGADVSGAEIIDGQVIAIDFGSSEQGIDITHQITVENSGTAVLNITSITISGSSFTLGSVAPTSVAIGATEIIDVVLRGTSIGIFIETITITNNDSDETVFDFPITGEIIAIPEPEIAVFEGADISGAEIIDGQVIVIDFGSGGQGTDITQQITIENSGTAVLTISSITISGSSFTLGSVAPTSIAIGATETIDVILSGASIGIFNETITITNNDSDETVFNFPIAGEITSLEEAEISVLVDGIGQTSGKNIIFEDALIGSSQIRELIITNTGTAPLVITNITIEGDDFSLESTIPEPIVPDDNTVLLISFSPTSLGSKSALLTIKSESTQDFTAMLMASGLSETPAIEIFNVVTAQQNGKHDFLEIRNIEFYNSNQVLIFSRWGDEVFRATDYNNSSNKFVGNSNDGDELPDGTYYYLIELDGGEIVKNGFFLLRR